MGDYLRSKIKADRVSIDPSKHKFYEELKGEGMPFQTMKDIFLAAAYFGYKKKKREPLKGKQQIFIKSAFKDEDLVDLFALAVAAEKNADVVHENNALEVVEQLANGGIEELRDLVMDLDDPFEELIQNILVMSEVH